MRFLVSVFIYTYCLLFYVLEIKAQSKPTIAEKVTNQNNELNEVVIKRQASLVKYSANGTIDVNVANTLLSTSSSVNELLGRVPNVIVAKGQISVSEKEKRLFTLMEF